MPFALSFSALSYFGRLARRGALGTALLLLITLAPAAAQTFEWARPRAVAYTANPDMLRTAASVGPGGRHTWWAGMHEFRKFHSQEALGSLNLTRHRADGRPAAQRVVEGTASVLALQALADGGVLLLGEFTDSLVFDAQHRYFNPNPNSGVEYFVTSLDSGGAVRWHRRLAAGPGASSTFVQGANSLTLDPRGGSVWVGYDTFADSYAMRVGLTVGDSLSTIVQQNVSRLTAVAVAPDGSVYTAGSCAETNGRYNGTPVALPTGITYNTYVACYSPTGQMQWVRHIEDVTCPSAWVATADTTGVYFVGPLFGQWQFGSHRAALLGGTGSSYFLTRLDRRTGNFQWLREAPITSFSGEAQAAMFQPLAIDGAGNAWLLATSAGTIMWPGFGPRTATGATLLAYDQAGTLRAVEVATGPRSAGHALSIDGVTGRGIVAGLAQNGGVQLGALPALPVVAASEAQVFAAGFQAVLAPLGLPDTHESATFGLSPNPVMAGGVVAVHGSGPAQIDIFDALGRHIVRHRLAGAGTNTLLAPVQRGLYLVQVLNGTHRTTRRLVVE